MSQEFFKPKGNIDDVFNRESRGRFESDLMNLRYEKDMAVKRNVVFLLLVVVCVVVMCYINLTANFKTYVVRVENATGRVELGNKLVATNYEPRDAELKYFISDFIRKIRTVPLDPILYKENWRIAQYFLMPEAATKLNNMIIKENQIGRLGSVTTQVTIRSLQKQPGLQNTFQVRWSEENFETNGSVDKETNFYVGLFSIIVIPPNKEEELSINPLGLKIGDLSYGKEVLK